MPSSSFFLLLSFSLLLRSVYGADYLYHFCSASQNFTSKGPFEANLNKLAGNLYLQVPKLGFGFGSSGQKPDQVFGLGLCRGDVSPSDCKKCVANASGEIRKRCPTNKAAVIWYDNCLYKHSHEKFFGRIDNKNKVYMWNVKVVNKTAQFNEEIRELLHELVDEAHETPKLYKTGDSEIEDSKTKLYGLVQCTRDLSNGDCKKCLTGIIGELRSCCDGKVGGRIISGSCNFRYEIYPFYKA
ncbi:cysteine-rich repeat secretory protein 38-like [Mercurialis annua]|uniref:cysteine-rich repeat secretory protein 38-like n=1 Tax=Mercurialis annua TaxID=3986 RepID=UPI00215FBE80|nr:cysteine-rich repeat secretory protein 38-like [Mercurialis annua]